jgi:hypothetical protein
MFLLRWTAVGFQAFAHAQAAEDPAVRHSRRRVDLNAEHM